MRPQGNQAERNSMSVLLMMEITLLFPAWKCKDLYVIDEIYKARINLFTEREETTMAELSVDVGKHVCKVLEEAEPDVLRGLLSNMSHLLMNAEADAACGAGYGQRSAVRRHSTLGIMNPND